MKKRQIVRSVVFMSQNNKMHAREHSIIMNKRKLWGCPKTSLLILNEYFNGADMQAVCRCPPDS